jgi:hypothetical protein
MGRGVLEPEAAATGTAGAAAAVAAAEDVTVVLGAHFIKRALFVRERSPVSGSTPTVADSSRVAADSPQGSGLGADRFIFKSVEGQTV